MNAIFLFNNQKEDVSRYLTRAARWIDVIRNGAHYEDAECCLVERMTEEEHKEIINYVFSVMEPTIKEISKYCINLWNPSITAKLFLLSYSLSTASCVGNKQS